MNPWAPGNLMLGLDLLDCWEYNCAAISCSELPPCSKYDVSKTCWSQKKVLRKWCFGWIPVTHHSLWWHKTFRLSGYLTHVLSFVMFFYCPSLWQVIFVTFVLFNCIINFSKYEYFPSLINYWLCWGGVYSTLCWDIYSSVPVFITCCFGQWRLLCDLILGDHKSIDHLNLTD